MNVLKTFSHFNSHAHVERDDKRTKQARYKHISTHTLTWSVTENGFKNKTMELISTHTLTWSVTWQHRTHLNSHGHFNSHAHVERDWQILPLLLRRHYFNSHAHVERDLQRCNFKNFICYFNSHAHVERDLILKILNNFILIFQLTRSRGAWPVQVLILTAFMAISTHTLTWSVTSL